MKALTFSVVYETAPESNWSAYVPDLPGCVSTGRTLEEVKKNIRGAIEGHLRVMREYGDPIPDPSTVVEMVELA